MLGNINKQEAQIVLSAKACDEKTPDDLKVACFKALARALDARRAYEEAMNRDALSEEVMSEDWEQPSSNYDDE